MQILAELELEDGFAAFELDALGGDGGERFAEDLESGGELFELGFLVVGEALFEVGLELGLVGG